MKPQLAALIATGEVKFTYKHMIVIGDGVRSTWAGEAAECAADQGQFWNYHDWLLKNQKTAPFTKENLKKWAGELGMDTKSFGQCLDSKKYEAKVQAESKEGRNLGLTGTPSFLINGKQIKLERSYDEVITAIKKELGK